MSVQSSTSDFNGLLDAISKSHSIRKHFDFYQWQQNYVNDFIPHDILIAAWGDFKTGDLHFDISSSILAVRAHQLTNGTQEVSPIMTELFNRWERNSDCWYFSEDFSNSKVNLNYSTDDKIISALKEMGTVLVYGFRDKRGENDVLYAFFNSNCHLKTDTSVLSLLMPHVDAALRRIDCIPEKVTKKIVNMPRLNMISGRESQVLDLVVQGKTNVEIADSLFISLNTVKNHLKNIFRKMDVSSRAEAVAKYLVEITPQQAGNVVNLHRKKENSIA